MSQLPVVVRVPACSFWWHTGVTVQAGHTYTFDVPQGQLWKDWWVESSPGGYSLGPFGRLLRVPKLQGKPINCYALIATVGEDLVDAVSVRSGRVWMPGHTGELVCFANDIRGFYWNNRGQVEFTMFEVNG